jgi:phosphate transport system substrate-binding protein
MTTWRPLLLLAALGAGLLPRPAVAGASPLDPYRPPTNESATIRIWGDRHLDGLARAWAAGYQAAHPGTAFVFNLVGNGSAMPALYLGQADVALFGRDLIVTDVDGFAHVRKYAPLRVELGTSSLATRGEAPALVLAVRRDNPLRKLTLQQVDAIFSSQRRLQAPAAILTWGQLGLAGDWADQPIHLYADDTESVTALFFQRVALGDSHRMNWAHFTEFSDRRNEGGTVVTAAEQSAAALQADPYGLAVTDASHLAPDLEPLALAAEPGGTYYAPTLENVISRRYPLARPIFACVDRPPDKSLNPLVRDFLDFVLSPEGQGLIEHSGGYLALTAPAALHEASKLK